MAHQNEIEIDSLRWLLSDQMIQERMADPTAKASNSTIVITLRDINTAEKILQKATLCVAGKPRKVERYNEVAADTQCPTCQGFGHRGRDARESPGAPSARKITSRRHKNAQKTGARAAYNAETPNRDVETAEEITQPRQRDTLPNKRQVKMRRKPVKRREGSWQRESSTIDR